MRVPADREHTELDIMAQIAIGRGLSRGAGDVLTQLNRLPLAAAADVAGVSRRPVSSVLANLRSLRGAGLVEASQLGCTLPQRQRWWLTNECLAVAGLGGTTWQDEQARRRLLELLPLLEQFYGSLAAIRNLGRFMQVQWVDALSQEGPSCDAVACFEYGWVPLFWCGSLLSETHLVDRLLRFPLDCQAMAVGTPQPWPSQICLVVMDQWAGETALRVLQDYGMERRAWIRCVADGTVIEPIGSGSSRGWVYQAVKQRAARGSWERSLETSPWSGSGGMEAAKALESVVDWPGSHLRFLKALCQEGRDQNRVRQTCRTLIASGLIQQAGDGRKARYFGTAQALNIRTDQDRIHHSDARTRTGLSQWQEASKRRLRRTVSKFHEDGLRDLLRPFVAKGCPVANGIRYTEHLGSEGGIAPDAMVYLTESPYGEGWHYVEYERSARNFDKIAKKLRGYGSKRRRDRYPVVLVCWNEAAETRFQAQGQDLGIALITTTIERLDKYGPLETLDCWSMYHERVVLG